MSFDIVLFLECSIISINSYFDGPNNSNVIVFNIFFKILFNKIIFILDKYIILFKIFFLNFNYFVIKLNVEYINI